MPKIIQNGTVFGSSPGTLADLSDTVITTPTNGQSLVYDGTTSKWKNTAPVGTIYSVIGTQTSATSAWTGVLHGVSALYDGLTINYYVPQNSVINTNVTLNLTLDSGTTTGAIGVYRNGGMQYTYGYNAGNSVILTYYSAGSISINGTVTLVDMWINDAYVNDKVEQKPTNSENVNFPIALSLAFGRRATEAVYSDYSNFTYNPSTTTLTVPNIDSNVVLDDTYLPYTAATVQNAISTLSNFSHEDVSTQIANGYANLTNVTADLFRIGNVGIFQIRCHCTSTIASGTVTLTTNIKSDANYSFRGALGCIDNKSGFMEYNNKTFLIRCPASTTNYLAGMIVFAIGF